MVKVYIHDTNAVAVSHDAKELRYVKTAMQALGVTGFLNRCEHIISSDNFIIYQYNAPNNGLVDKITVVAFFGDGDIDG